MHSQSRKCAQSAQPAHQTSTPQSGVRQFTSNLHSIPEDLVTVGTRQDRHQAFNLDPADQPIRGGISYHRSAPRLTSLAELRKRTDLESEETIHQPRSYTPVSDVEEDIEEDIEEEGKEEDKNEDEDDDEDEEMEDDDEDEDERSVPVQPHCLSEPISRVIRRLKGRASAAKVDAPRAEAVDSWLVL
ncbi:hypothetical protein BKA93DRAFT_830837 [Sparassis latifolia]